MIWAYNIVLKIKCWNTVGKMDCEFAKPGAQYFFLIFAQKWEQKIKTITIGKVKWYTKSIIDHGIVSEVSLLSFLFTVKVSRVS